MNRRRSLCILLALLCGVGMERGLAGGFRLASQDAFATARGEAFVATADNPSAIYYNPAGITQLEGFNVRGGLYALDYEVSYRPPAAAANKGHTYHNEEHLAAIPQLFSTYTPEDSAVSFGLGLYCPYGGSMSWPDDTGFRSIATKGELTYYRLSPVVALKLAPELSVAGGALIDYADMDLEQGLRPATKPLINYFRFKGQGWSGGYSLGLRWQPRQQLAFGMTFRSSTPLTLKDRTEFEQLPILQPSHRAARAEFEFPLTAVFGVSYRPTPKWNLEFDADYTDWSSFGTVSVRQDSPPYPLHAETPVTLRWQPSWMFELGATRYFEHGWRASAGYVFSQSSVPDAYYTPLASDMDRHFFSVGAGWTHGRLSLDLAYQLGYGPDRVVQGSQPSSQPGLFSGQRADGTYGFLSQALILSAGWRF